MERTDLAFAGIARQAELIRAGEVSPRELVELYLERVARIDPQLNAVRVVFAERALAEADQAAARRAAGEERPLLGVPVLIKDDTDVAGEVTCKGSAAEDRPAREDAEVVRRLRGAGAIVLGKTHVPELMQWPFTESATWGITRNPWDPGRSPGGSSGGSAAAVAAGLVGAASASDGAGSIRIPASCCALFGLKGQRGRIPTAPYDITWQGLTHVGCVTRSVRDTALWWDVVADRLDGDPSGTWVEAAERGMSNPPTLRIACATNNALFAPLATEQRAGFEETVALLRSLGHTVEQVRVPYGDLLGDLVPRYLRGIAEDAAAVAHPRRLERRTRAMARMGRLLPDALVARARRHEAATAERLNRLLADHDVLLTPGTAGLPLPIGRYEGRGAIWTFNGVGRYTPYTPAWNITGQPAASVPAGFTADGVPLAVQLVGRPQDEATLLALAAQLEVARPWADRRPPLAA
ncbi:MAG: amidase [Actinobacteria bacterium]|nr:amidase [Actinomycetota bacterium]